MNYFFVYILKCNDGKYYTGHTDELEKRIAEHQSGNGGTFTAKRLPIKLVFSHLTESRETAFQLERKIKLWTRRKKEALINNNFKLLKKFSKKKFKKLT